MSRGLWRSGTAPLLGRCRPSDRNTSPHSHRLVREGEGAEWQPTEIVAVDPRTVAPPELLLAEDFTVSERMQAKVEAKLLGQSNNVNATHNVAFRFSGTYKLQDWAGGNPLVSSNRTERPPPKSKSACHYNPPPRTAPGSDHAPSGTFLPAPSPLLLSTCAKTKISPLPTCTAASTTRNGG